MSLSFNFGPTPKLGPEFRQCESSGRGSKLMASHFGVGAPPILVYFSGDWDVHWRYDLDFDPWPSAGGDRVEPTPFWCVKGSQEEADY